MERWDGSRASTIDATLRRVEERLRERDARGALVLLDAIRDRDVVLENARGVCLMRVGRTGAAVELYQRLVLPGDSLAIGPDVPAVLVTNFATALLLDGNVRGCLVVLHEIRQEAHPSVVRLRAAVAAWRDRSGWLSRLRLRMYGVASPPIALDGPPGELLLRRPPAPHAA